MSIKVSVPVLYDQTGLYLNRQLFTVGVDAEVVGTVQKPDGYAVPPRTAPLIDALQIKDSQLGTLFLAMSLEQYQAAVDLATNPVSSSSVSSVFGRVGNVIADSSDYASFYESLVNKATDFLVLNNVKYPTNLAVDTYVRGLIAAAIVGINPTPACQVSTFEPLQNSPTYNNGTAGVGATLTASVNGALTFPSYTPIVGDRVLVQFEINQAWNGIYTVTATGSGGAPYVLTRATDYDQISEINAGGVIAVEVYDGPEGEETNSLWVLASQIVTIGTSPFIFTNYSYGTNIVALVTRTLAQFAATTSAELAGVLSDETGFSGGAKAVFSVNPTLDGLQLSDNTSIAGNSGTGNKIGGASDKWGFFGAPPVAQQSAVDGYTALINLGLASALTALAATKGGTGISSYVLGDIVYASAANTLTALAGNTTTTKRFLSQTGNGTISAAPAWAALAAADIPDLSATYGRLNTANTWTAAQRGATITLTDQPVIAINMALGNCYKLVLGGNRIVAIPTNIVANQSGVFVIKQSLSGPFTLAWAPIFTFAGGTPPSLTGTKGAVDILPYIVNSYLSSSAITATNGANGVFTWAAHGLDDGDHIWFTAGTTTVPVLNTVYWVRVLDANTFNLASSLVNLGAGTYITTSGISGTLTGASGSITISNILGVQ